MRWLIVNTDYRDFLRWLYQRHPGLAEQPYQRQLQARNECCFGTADFYSANLRALGHEAQDVHFNNPHLQRAWAAEHGAALSGLHAWRWRRRRGIVPWPTRVPDDRWQYQVLEAQIRHHQPDVLYLQDIGLDPRFLLHVRPLVRLLVGQIAAPLPEPLDLRAFDLLLSSLPHYVEQFRARGADSELLRLAVEPRVLAQVGSVAPGVPVSFVGNLFASHGLRRRWLEQVAAGIPIDVWCPQPVEAGPGADGSALRHHGPAWGLDMYRVLRTSRITLNHHIDIAGPHANNMRLFEATAMGTLLLTDWKLDLAELFEPEREVVTYRDTAQCVARIRYYLEHESERAAIAAAGQARALRDHAYSKRIAELVRLVEPRLARGRREQVKSAA